MSAPVLPDVAMGASPRRRMRVIALVASTSVLASLLGTVGLVLPAPPAAAAPATAAHLAATTVTYGDSSGQVVVDAEQHVVYTLLSNGDVKAASLEFAAGPTPRAPLSSATLSNASRPGMDRLFALYTAAGAVSKLIVGDIGGTSTDFYEVLPAASSAQNDLNAFASSSPSSLGPVGGSASDQMSSQPIVAAGNANRSGAVGTFYSAGFKVDYFPGGWSGGSMSLGDPNPPSGPPIPGFIVDAGSTIWSNGDNYFVSHDATSTGGSSSIQFSGNGADSPDELTFDGGSTVIGGFTAEMGFGTRNLVYAAVPSQGRIYLIDTNQFRDYSTSSNPPPFFDYRGTTHGGRAGAQPQAIVLDKTNRLLYVTDKDDSYVSVIDAFHADPAQWTMATTKQAISGWGPPATSPVAPGVDGIAFDRTSKAAVVSTSQRHVLLTYVPTITGPDTSAAQWYSTNNTITPAILSPSAFVDGNGGLPYLDINNEPVMIRQALSFVHTMAGTTGLPAGMSVAPDGTMTGTPTQAGVFDVHPVSEFRHLPETSTAAFVSTPRGVTNSSPAIPLKIWPDTPANATVAGGALTYSQSTSRQLVADWMDASRYPQGWAQPTWTLANGSTLPPGLSLSSAGVLTGTPTAAGTYTFSVVANNGTSTAGAAAVAAQQVGYVAPASATLPVTITVGATQASAPQGLTVTGGPQSLALSFTDPSNDGGQVQKFQYSTDNGSTWKDVTTSPTARRAGGTFAASVSTVSGSSAALAVFTSYDVKVRAVNSWGNGLASSAVPARTAPNAPTVPRNLTATGGGGSIALTFDDPSNDGGALDSFEYSTDNGVHWSTLVTTPATAHAAGPYTATITQTTGSAPVALSASTSYSVVIRAKNSGGTSPATSAASATTTAGPGVVGSFMTTVGNGQIGLSFTAPTTGAAVTGYQYSTNGGQSWTTFTPTGSGPLAATISGLSNGTSYPVTVRATSAQGNGGAVQPVATTPNTAPTVPTGLTATAVPGGASIAFTAPTTGGTPSSYQVQVNGGSWTTVTTTAGSGAQSGQLVASVSPLANGQASTISVRSVNSAGQSTGSPTASVTPYAAPAAPGAVTATAGNTSVALSFAPAGSTAQAPVTGYQYSTNGGSSWQSLTTSGSSPLTATVTGLTNNTPVTVQVRAVNAVAQSSAVSANQVTPSPQVPTVPLSFTATSQNTALGVSFAAPADDGGSALTRFEYSTGGGSWATLTTTPSSATAAGPFTGTITTASGGGSIVNGQAYSVAVRAVNAVGSSPATTTSSVTPAAGPNPVTSLVATPGDTQATLTFTPPSSGPAVSSYQYSTNGTTWTTLNTIAGTGAQTGQRVATLTGLTNGQAITYQVRAVGANGHSSAVSAPAITPNALPPAPGAVTATPTSGGASLSFAPSTGGSASSVNGYMVSVNGGSWQALTTAGSNPLTASIAGLTNGTAASVRVVAVSPQGQSSPTSAVSVTPVGSPAAPGSATATPGNASIGLSFQPVTSTSATPVTGYAVSLNGGPYAPVTTSGSSPLTVNLTSYNGSPLANGTTYAVSVVAVNASGNGAAANAGSVTPNVAPVAPVIASLTAGNGTATVSITAPSLVNGSSAITGYEYSPDGGATWYAVQLTSAASANPATGSLPSGLTNGQQASIVVRALNTSGPGAASAPQTVMPFAPAGQPGAVTATAGPSSALLSFAPAATSAGAPVTGYQYSTNNGGTWTPLTLTSAPGATPLTASVNSPNGTPVTVQVRANGTGGPSSPRTANTVTPANLVPGVPVALVVTPADQALNLAFSAPVSDGGAVVTSYEYSTDGSTWVVLGSVGSGSTLAPSLPAAGPFTAHVTKVTAAGNAAMANNQQYAVQVRAVNSVGNGTATAAVNGTPLPVPSAPQLMTVTPGNTTATITFTPATSGPAPSGYRISTTGANGPWAIVSTTPGTGPQTGQLFITQSGLPNGSPVQYWLQAVGANGNSAAVTAAAVTPNTPPGSPTGVTATALPVGATLSFTPPTGAGSTPITAYQVVVNGTGQPLPMTVTSAPGASPVTGTITGLVNGTSSSLSVQAVAPHGTGAASAPVSVTPYGVPAAPASVTTSVYSGTIGLSFPAVTSTAGTPVTGYQVSTNGGLSWTTITPTSAPGASTVTGLISGLANGTGYQVQVRALGGGSPAVPGTAVATSPATTTPLALASPPVGLVATGTNAGLQVAFADPVSTGGSAVTRYEVSTDGGLNWVTLSTTPAAPGPGPYSGTLASPSFTLTNGTQYQVAVRAVTSTGNGAASTLSPATPSSASPTAVRGLTAGPAVTGATVAFTTPATTGGAPITGYAYRVGGSGPWLPLTVTSVAGTHTASITGLPAGSPVTLAVAAVTASGLNPPAGASATVSVTPTAAPPVGGGGGGGAGGGASTPSPSSSPSPSGGSAQPPLAPGTVPPAGQAAPPVMVAPGPATRISGATRTDTATALSTALWPSRQTVPAVVVMSSVEAADGIAGSRLAQAVGGPVLLTTPGALSAETKVEITRVLMSGGKVYVLGGTRAVSSQVEDQIDALPGSPRVERLQGADRFETSVKIAEEIDGLGKSGGPAYLGAGTDASMAAPLAARTSGVVLLTQDGNLPASVADYLRGKQQVVAIGGPASRAVPQASSVVGADRYATAAKVAEQFTSSGSAPSVFAVANGENWPDQVTGGASMALLGGPLLLTQPSELSGAARGAISGMSSLRAGMVVGGTQAVSPSVAASLRSMGF